MKKIIIIFVFCFCLLSFGYSFSEKNNILQCNILEDVHVLKKYEDDKIKEFKFQFVCDNQQVLYFDSLDKLKGLDVISKNHLKWLFHEAMKKNFDNVIDLPTSTEGIFCASMIYIVSSMEQAIRNNLMDVRKKKLVESIREFDVSLLEGVIVLHALSTENIFEKYYTERGNILEIAITGGLKNTAQVLLDFDIINFNNVFYNDNFDKYIVLINQMNSRYLNKYPVSLVMASNSKNHPTSVQDSNKIEPYIDFSYVLAAMKEKLIDK